MTKLTDAERASSSTATPMEIEAAIQAIENPGDCQSGTIARAASTLVQVARRFLRDEARQFRERLTEPAPVSPSPAPDTAALLAEAERLDALLAGFEDRFRLVGNETVGSFRAAYCRLAAALRAEQETSRIKRAVIREICEEWSEANGATCDPLCSSLGHEEGCRAVEIAAYLRSLRTENTRLQQRVAAFEALARRVAYEIETGVQETWPKGQVPAYVERARDLLIASDPRSLSQLRDAVCALDQSVAADAGDPTCKKVPHSQKGGYLHAANDDSPFHVDGVMYCGRCHSTWPCNPARPTAKP